MTKYTRLQQQSLSGKILSDFGWTMTTTLRPLQEQKRFSLSRLIVSIWNHSYLQANLCFHNALHQVLNRAKCLSPAPQVYFSTEASRMRCLPLAPVFLLQKNIAPAEAARAMTSPGPQGRTAVQRTTIGTLQNAIEITLCADVHRFIFFLELYMVRTKTLKMFIKNHLLLSLSQHRTFGSFCFFLPPILPVIHFYFISIVSVWKGTDIKHVFLWLPAHFQIASM